MQQTTARSWIKLAIMTLLLWAAMESKKRDSANELLEQAVDHAGRGDFKKADQIAGQAVDMAACNALGHTVRGAILRKQGDYPRALEQLDEAIRIDPQSADAHCQRAFVHLQNPTPGGLDKAFRDATRSIELNSSNALPYLLRGNVRSARGEWAMALADYSQAIELNPKSYASYGRRALVHARLENLQAARHDIEMACGLNPPESELVELKRFRDIITRKESEGVGAPVGVVR